MGMRGLANFELTDEEKEQIRARIMVLEVEHGDLDYIIATLSQDPVHDQLRLRRLKKRKLILKDQIALLKDRLIPDIIA
ncbi:MAG: YdcH family protein [Burkholderiales bacterium]